MWTGEGPGLVEKRETLEVKDGPQKGNARPVTWADEALRPPSGTWGPSWRPMPHKYIAVCDHDFKVHRTRARQEKDHIQSHPQKKSITRSSLLCLAHNTLSTASLRPSVRPQNIRDLHPCQNSFPLAFLFS